MRFASDLSLPIDESLGEILSSAEQNSTLIIEAPPGSGKTTRVAPTLLEGSFSRQGRIVLVEPRRIAVRAAASRIALEIGSRVGDTVGYHVRFDRQISRDTRLAVVTPGILLRELQGDGVLSQINTVVLDEFHERSLEYDLILGMVRRIQESIRPDLRLVIMSATINTAAIAEYLSDARVIRVPGTMFPVSIRHSKFDKNRRIVDSATEHISTAAERDTGDILVFLPGVGEILQVARNIEAQATKHRWEVLPLYGDLSPDEQDRVLRPSPYRKVILSTNVAETSLTIDGVRIVIDSGWARIQRADPALGLNVLGLEPISQASAEQRAGRAGRTAPGVCWRLWDEVTHRSRPLHTDPEILRVDLSGAVLQLICFGESEVLKFPWLTPPKSMALEQAREYLERIDAIDNNRPTDLGRILVELPVQPRLGRLLVAGHRYEIPHAAALAAAMLSERDVFDRRAPMNAGDRRPFTKTAMHWDCDVTERVQNLQNFFATGRTNYPQGEVRIGAARQVERSAQQLVQCISAQLGNIDTEQSMQGRLATAVLAAMPDRVARRREANKPRGLMVGGRGVKLDPTSGVQQSELFVCVDVDAAGVEANVRQATGIQRRWLDEQHIRVVDERFLHPTQGTVVTRRRTYWFDLVLEETPIATPLDEETARLLAEAAKQQWHRVFPHEDKSLQSFFGRARWLSAAMPDLGWPDLSDEGIQKQVPQWAHGQRDLESIRTLPWRALIEQLLSHEQRVLLDREAPASYALPSGRQVLLAYEADKAPVLAARIQDFFGLQDTPRIAGGRVRLLLHLLAPNNRCQQITDDLASFWKNTYPEVRKQLRGRYPKHDWPEQAPLK